MKIFEDGHAIIKYDSTYRFTYWVELTNYIQTKFASKEIEDIDNLEAILFSAYEYLIRRFEGLINSETSFTFFSDTFLLHEESIKLYFKTLDGYKLKNIEENEFAVYRRILKLILQEGCSINLNWGTASAEESQRIQNKLSHLIYIGTWIYDLSDKISYMKMIEEPYNIDVENGLLGIGWNYHYEMVIKTLHKMIKDNGYYEQAIFDETAPQELVDKIEECFGFHTSTFFSLIQNIQKHHNPNNPNEQTIEPNLLPVNLAHMIGRSEEEMVRFCNGLTINSHNKPSVAQTIYNPTNSNRYAFRPILVYHIEGVERALIGENKINETFQMLTTNSLHWGGLPDEWLENDDIKKFMDEKDNTHEQIYIQSLKKSVDKITSNSDYNITVFRKKDNHNHSINSDPGEIDLIIILPNQRRLIIGDVKYGRARYEGVGWQKDYTNFLRYDGKKDYETKLNKKHEWVLANMNLIQEHFEVKDNIKYSIFNFSIEAVFFVNTPTFYMFNGNYRAIATAEIEPFLLGWKGTDIIDPNDQQTRYSHPYFRKPTV